MLSKVIFYALELYSRIEINLLLGCSLNCSCYVLNTHVLLLCDCEFSHFPKFTAQKVATFTTSHLAPRLSSSTSPNETTTPMPRETFCCYYYGKNGICTNKNARLLAVIRFIRASSTLLLPTLPADCELVKPELHTRYSATFSHQFCHSSAANTYSTSGSPLIGAPEFTARCAAWAA